MTTIESALSDVLARPRYCRGPGYATVCDAEQQVADGLRGASPAAVEALVARYGPPGPDRRAACRALSRRFAPEASRDWRLWVQAEVETWAGIRRPAPLRCWARRLGMGERTLRRWRNGPFSVARQVDALSRLSAPQNR